MRKISFWMLASLLFSFVVITSCSKDEEPEPDPTPTPDVQIAENVHVFDTTILAGMLPLDTNTYNLVFTTWPSGVTAPKAGEIAVAGVSPSTPYGLLRKITGVTPSGNGYQCTTEPAKLDEVILQGSISLHQQKLNASRIKSLRLEPGVTLNTLKRPDLLGFDMYYETDLDNSGNAKAYGSFYFDMGFDFDFSVGLTTGIQMESALTIKQEAGLGVRATGNWSGKEAAIGEIEFMPWVIQVGPIPVVFVPKAKLKLKTGGGVSAEMETFAMEHLETRLGIKYNSSNDDEWDLINECNPTYNLQWPSLTADANFWLKLGPEVSLKLYGQAGPFFDVLARTNLEATLVGKSVKSNFNLNYELWLEANAGIDVTLLGFIEFNQKFNLFEKLIASKTINGEPIPSGIQITTPSANSTVVIGTTVPISVLVNGQPSDGLRIYIDNLLKATLTQPPYSWDWQVQETEGQHTLKVEAIVGGEVLTHSINVTVAMASWSEVAVNGLSTWETINAVQFSSFSYGMAVGYYSEPMSSNESYGFVATTSDGGTTWSKVFTLENGFNGFDDLVMNGNSPIVCGEDIGLYWQVDGDWVQMTDQYGEYVSASMVETSGAGTLVFADGIEIKLLADGLWYRSGNGEITISPEIWGGTSQPEIVDMAFDGTEGYFVGYSVGPESWIYRTTDGGFAWTQITTPGGANYELSSVAINNGRLVVTGRSLNDGPEIYWSDNDGNTWHKAQIPAYFTGPYYDLFTLKDVVLVDENIGYAAGVMGTTFPGSSILTTNDGGQTWTTTNLTAQYPYYEIKSLFFADKYHGWAGGYSYPNPTGGSNGLLFPSIFRYGIGN